MEPIEINGIELLNDEEKKIANKLLNEYYPKIQRQIKNKTSLRAYFKKYDKEGREKYSIDIDVVAPGKIFQTKAFDWTLAKALHKVLNKMMNKIEHTLHASEQH